MNPRYYQQEAVDAIYKEFELGTFRTLLTQPTGTGKTATAGFAIKRWIEERNTPVLALAHRRHLTHQLAVSFRRMGIDAAVEMGDERARKTGFFVPPKVVVGTVQSFQGERLLSWPRDYFGLVINDECHRAADESHRAVRNWFDGALEIGLTATPEGASGKIGNVYQTRAYKYSIVQGVRDKWIVPHKRILCKTPIDLTGIRTAGKDLNAADIAVRIGPHIEFLADAIKQLSGSKAIAVFMPDKASTILMAQMLCKPTGSGPGIKARAVTGYEGPWGMSSNEAARNLRDFENREYQAIVSCEMLFEGWDCPFIEVVANCRPTTLLYRYAQTVGRGLRICPEIGKTECLILDFDWRAGDKSRDIITPVEFLARDDDELSEGSKEFSPDVIARIIERARRASDAGEDAEEALEKAKKYERELSTLPMFVRGSKAVFETEEIDPFAAADYFGVKLSKKHDIITKSTRAPSSSCPQIFRLQEEGINEGEKLTKYGAGKIISESERRRKNGLATLEQVSMMVRSGVPKLAARAMTEHQAKKMLAELRSQCQEAKHDSPRSMAN